MKTMAAVLCVACSLIMGCHQKNNKSTTQSRDEVLSGNLKSDFNDNLIGKNSQYIRNKFGSSGCISKLNADTSSEQWAYYDNDNISYLINLKDGLVAKVQIVAPSY